jgi:hypothetical protein
MRMDEPMTHERCSELLRDYVRGELGRAVEDEVRTHLAQCADCSVEERALTALLGAPEPMDDVERARLHRALAQELYTTPANADVAATGSAGRPWQRWVVPALGSAAAVLVVVLVLASGGISITGGDEDPESGMSAPAQERADGGAADASGGGGGGTGRTGDRAMKLDEAQIEAARAAPAGPRPEFDADAGSLTVADLSGIGRSSELFRSFSTSYAAGDIPALEEEFLRVLEKSAGSAGAEVTECAGTLPQDGTLLPAFGALAEYEGEDALVLGFVTGDSGSSLDRYLMWVWARGSCRQPIETLFEEIDTP